MNAIKITKGKKICPACGILFNKGSKIYKDGNYHPDVEGCPYCSNTNELVVLKDYYEPLSDVFKSKKSKFSFLKIFKRSKK